MTISAVIKIIIGIVLLFVGYHALRFRLLINKGIAISAAAVPFQHDTVGASMRILVMGDSSAVGTGSVRPEDSVAGRIAAYYPEAEVLNFGVNGLRVAGLNEKLNNPPPGEFDLVVLQIGGNDITHRTPIADVEKNLREVLQKAKKLADTVIILHTGDLGKAPIWPPLIGRYITKQTLVLRDMYLRVVPEMGATYVDLYGARVDDTFAKDLYRYYGVDQFHLSGDGYGVWFEEIKKVLPKGGVI